MRKRELQTNSPRERNGSATPRFFDAKPSVFVIDSSPILKSRLTRIQSLPLLVLESLDALLQWPALNRRGVVMLRESYPLALVALQKAAASESPPTILVDASELNGIQVANLMQEGAAGVWSAELNDEQLQLQIDRAIRIEQKLWNDWKYRFDQQQRLASLNEKEIRVLKLVVSGCPNKWISKKLGISQRTVELRRHEIHEKTNTKNVAHLVRLVMEADWRIEDLEEPCEITGD